MSEAAKPLDYAAMLKTFEATRRERDRLSADVRPINKRTLFDLLAAAGITRVVVVFDGYGDSGQIESITPFAGETEATFPADQITLRQVRSDASGLDEHELAVHQAIESLAYDLLEETHPGWENNDGAFGEFVFDVGPRRSRSSTTSASPTSNPLRTTGEEAIMGHCYHHALSSVRKWGGAAEDYLPLHQWFDESKAITADFRHRALRHHAEGIFMLERFFGATLSLSTGRIVPVRLIGEQHVREDLGYIPSFADWVRAIRPEQWMGRAQPIHLEVDPFAVLADGTRPSRDQEATPGPLGDRP